MLVNQGSPSRGKSLRSLGFFEQMLALEHEHTGERCTVLGATLVEGFIDEARVSGAARSLWARHPLLRASIHRRSREDGHELRGDVPFSVIPVIARRGSIESGWAEADELLHAPLPQSTCLWRITLVSEGVGADARHLVLIIVHHSIADGLSVLRLMAEFLRFVESGEHEVEGLPFLPPVEAQLARRSVWAEYQRRRRLQAERQAERSSLPVARRVTLSERMHRNIFETLSVGDTGRLVSVCRSQRTSVTGALHAALALTAIELGCTGPNVPFLVAVNLRGRCAPPLDRSHVGCFVSSYEMVLATPSKDFWEVARHARAAIHEAVPELADTPHQFPVRELTTLPGTSSELDTASFESGYCISNVGRVEGLCGTSARVDGMWFASNRHTGDIALLLSVCTVDERLNLCYSYTEPLLDRAVACRLASGCTRRLIEVIA